MEKNHILLLGAHMSISGGIEKSILRGEEIGCTCIQIFTKSNRQWYAKDLSEKDINLFLKLKKKSTIKVIVAHAGYLINIGSTNKEILKKSMQSANQELERCIKLQIPFYNIHPGTCKDLKEKNCLLNITKNLDELLEKNPGDTKILLETMAGQGNTLGERFEQLAEIKEKSKYTKRIGICFDTCHSFVAGYDFRTKETFTKMWEHFDKIIGINNLKAMHINDSLKDLNSKIDRHQHIGKGKLGLEAFKLIFNDERFFDIPKILETPHEKNMKEDIENMETIKKLISPKNKLLLNMN